MFLTKLSLGMQHLIKVKVRMLPVSGTKSSFLARLELQLYKLYKYWFSLKQIRVFVSIEKHPDKRASSEFKLNLDKFHRMQF